MWGEIQNMEEYAARAFAQFYDALPRDSLDDTVYEEHGVELELPFADAVHASFDEIEQVVAAYEEPEPVYASKVTERTLSNLLIRSESVVDEAIFRDGAVSDRQLVAPDNAVQRMGDADTYLFDERAAAGVAEPQRNPPFLILDDHEDYYSYTAIIVGAENHLGCNDRKIVFPSSILAYSGTVSGEEYSDVEAFVEDMSRSPSPDDSGDPYDKYAAVMDRLAEDTRLVQQVKDAARMYEMLHPDCETGTSYVDTPEQLREQQEQLIVDAVQELGDTGAEFSYDMVLQKLTNNDVLLIDLMETEADEILDDLDQTPWNQYITEHPETPLLHMLPGKHVDDRDISLSHPNNEKYFELIEQVAAYMDQDADPAAVIDSWAQSQTVTEQTSKNPDHVDRMYQ